MTFLVLFPGLYEEAGLVATENLNDRFDMTHLAMTAFNVSPTSIVMFKPFKMSTIDNEHSHRWIKLGFQLARYGMVGVTVTLIHNFIYYLLMNNNNWTSTINNLISFMICIQMSYWGHRMITFMNPATTKTKSTLKKFVSVACFNLLISSTVSYIFIDVLDYNYKYMIIFNVSCLPLISFLVMKFWIFK